MKYYKVDRFVKIQIVADEDADRVPSDWVDVTDKVRHRLADKPNVKLPSKPKAKAKKADIVTED